MGLDPATTLHDVRWGAPVATTSSCGSSRSPARSPRPTCVGGYAGAVSERQPPMYFGLGGGTIKGVSKPGEVVWSRVFLMDGALQVDMGSGQACRTTRRGDAAALGRHHAAMADHARSSCRA